MSDESMPGLNDPHEKEIGKGPHVWLQWKGTDVCCDFHCTCGASGHIDADFMYFVKCHECGQLYEVGTHVRLYPVTAEQHWGAQPIIPDGAE